MSLNVGDKNAKITVLLMNKAGDMIIDRTDLQLKDGLLPIRELKNKWNANGIIWTDIEEEIKEGKDGYSTISFAFFDKIKVIKKE